MDLPSMTPWLFDLDSTFLNELEPDYLGDESLAALLGDDGHDMDHHALSSESNSSSTITSTFSLRNTTNSTTAPASSSAELPHQVALKAKQQKPHSYGTTATPPSVPIVLDFCSGSAIAATDYMSRHTPQKSTSEKEKYDDEQTRKRKASRSIGGQCRDDHILAERMRREKLSQKFIALSALIPALKKMDKTSVLGEAINLIKQLQKRLAILEEETAKRGLESVVTVKKSRVTVEDDERHCTSSSQYFAANDEQLPEIEAKFSNKTVLLKVHCQKQRGLIVRLVTEIEKLHLFVINIHAVPFTDSTLDMTIITQMELEFNMTPTEIAKFLHTALQ
ncbi:hypothetical protein Ancab_003636 [Ancistrocladus abbreviatus]